MLRIAFRLLLELQPASVRKLWSTMIDKNEGFLPFYTQSQRPPLSRVPPSPGSLIRPKLVESVHYCVAKNEFHRREYRDELSPFIDSTHLPTINVFPKKVRRAHRGPGGWPGRRILRECGWIWLENTSRRGTLNRRGRG